MRQFKSTHCVVLLSWCSFRSVGIVVVVVVVVVVVIVVGVVVSCSRSKSGSEFDFYPYKDDIVYSLISLHSILGSQIIIVLGN